MTTPDPTPPAVSPVDTAALRARIATALERLPLGFISPNGSGSLDVDYAAAAEIAVEEIAPLLSASAHREGQAWREIERLDADRSALGDAQRRTRRALLPILAGHPLIRDSVKGDEFVKTGWVAERAAELLRWYGVEVERLTAELRAVVASRPAIPDDVAEQIATVLSQWVEIEGPHEPEVQALTALFRSWLATPTTGPAPAAADECSCNGGWVEDQNFQPEDYERNDQLKPGKGLIPCGLCNHGGWDADWPPAAPQAPALADQPMPADEKPVLAHTTGWQGVVERAALCCCDFDGRNWNVVSETDRDRYRQYGTAMLRGLPPHIAGQLTHEPAAPQDPSERTARVWKFGDPQPVGVKGVTDRKGRLWWFGGDFWRCVHDRAITPGNWEEILPIVGPLTESFVTQDEMVALLNAPATREDTATPDGMADFDAQLRWVDGPDDDYGDGLGGWVRRTPIQPEEA